jgi:hypothetical protein
MKVSELQNHLAGLGQLELVQANGQKVPAHFHITEMGLTTKHFVDCGGTVRTEQVANLQVWVANDVWHRLSPQKLSGIIDKSSALLNGMDLEVEVEYQTDTIGRYGLSFSNGQFVLQSKNTDCLAREACSVPQNASQFVDAAMQKAESCCGAESTCC